MEPKGNGEVGKPVSGATSLADRGGFFHVLAEGGILNHLRSRRADSTTGGAQLINTLFGKVDKKTLIDAPEPSPTPKTEFTELSLRPPKDRLNRERRPDFDKVYPDMSKWLIQRLKNVVEIQKTNPQMCEKGGVLANEYLLAQAMIGDAGTIAEVKVKEYFKDPQAYATTITMIEDSLATLAFSQGKYAQRHPRGERINPDRNVTVPHGIRDALPQLIAAVSSAALANASVLNLMAAPNVPPVIGSMAGAVQAFGQAVLGAAGNNPNRAIDAAAAAAAGAGAVALGVAGVNQLRNQEGNPRIQKLRDALEMVQHDTAAVEAVKKMYGIDPMNIEFNGDTILFIDDNTNSPAWAAAQEQIPYLSRMRQEYYRHVHRIDPCLVDGMPEQYLADSDADTNLRIEQTGSKAEADIQEKFNTKIREHVPPGIANISREERLKLMAEARREWLGERMNAQFDKSSLKKDAAKRAREKVMITTQIDKLKKGAPPAEDGETRKSAKAEAKKSVKLHENLLTFEDIKAEPDSLVGYLQPVEALAKNRQDLAAIAAKYARTSVPTTPDDCQVLINAIQKHINVADTSSDLYQTGPARESVMSLKKGRDDRIIEDIGKLIDAAEKSGAKDTGTKIARYIEQRNTLLAASLQQYTSERQEFDQDIARLNAIAGNMRTEMAKLGKFGAEAKAIKSVVEKLTVRPGGGADRLGIPTTLLILFGTPGNSFQELMAATNQTLIPVADRDKPEYQKELIRAIADAKAEQGIGRALAGPPPVTQPNLDIVTTNLGYELLGMTDAEALAKLGTAVPPLVPALVDAAGVPPYRRAMEGVLKARSKAYKETLAIVGYQKEQAVVNEKTVDTDCDAKEKAYEIIRNRFLEADRGKAAYEIATKMVRDFATMFDARLLPTAGVDYDVLTQAERAAAAGLPERSIINLLEAIFKYKDTPENSTIKDPSESFRAVNTALGGGLMLPTIVELFVRDLNLAAVLPVPPPPPTYVEMMNAVRAQNLVTPYSVPQMQKVVSGIINHVCEKATLGNI